MTTCGPSGSAGAILLVSRLLTHEHDPRGGPPPREDQLRGVLPQVAPPACLSSLATLRVEGTQRSEP